MGKIKVTPCDIKGLYVIEPTVFKDERGYFMETYNYNDFKEAGIDCQFVQDNQSMSTKGVLRGLHFQKQYPQCKLVRAVRGTVFDVAVDLRSNSETYGKWYGVTLSAENKKQFLIDRIRAFEDTCQEYHVPYELNLNVIGDSYQDIFAQMKHIFSDIDEKYPDKKKGIFLANDTYANMFLNLIFQKYGCFPDSYELVGFDNSPIASEAILPITTVGQQIDLIAKTAIELLVQQMEERKKRRPVPLSEPVHKQITPVLIRRDTTS